MEELKQEFRCDEILDVKQGEIIDMNEYQLEDVNPEEQPNTCPDRRCWQKLALFSIFILTALAAFHLIIHLFDSSSALLSKKKLPPFNKFKP